MRNPCRQAAICGLMFVMFTGVGAAQACPNAHSPDGACTCTGGCTCCGGTDSPKPKVDPPPPEDGVVDILISGYRFVPDDITVPVGTTVRWTNLDADFHDTVSADGLWDSGYFYQGESFSYMIEDDNLDQLNYVCTLHGGMTGVINVVPAPEPGSIGSVLLFALYTTRRRDRRVA